MARGPDRTGHLVQRRFCAAVLTAVLWSAWAAAAAGAGGWSIQPTPEPAGALASGLLGVSCTRASACTAVGFSQARSGEYLTLAERWNGSSWEIRSTETPAGRAGVLHGVSCTGPRSCTAVGDYQPIPGYSVTLAERWNGATWEIQPTPNPAGATLSVLYGVSCSGPDACVAAGEQVTSTGIAIPLMERWNGSSWEIQPTPIPAGAMFSTLGGVSCSSASACTTTGLYYAGTDEPRTLAERWNGDGWEIQPTPNPAVDSQVSLAAVRARRDARAPRSASPRRDRARS
jgi:hypothetical protein